MAHCANKYIGLFKTAEEAAAAYDRAAARKFGEFAHPNKENRGHTPPSLPPAVSP